MPCHIVAYQGSLGQVQGGNTDLIILKNAITFYLIVFLGVVGMGCCGEKRFPGAGGSFLILFTAARKVTAQAHPCPLPPPEASMGSLPGRGAHTQWLSENLLPPGGLNHGVSGPNAMEASILYFKILCLWRFVLLA